jgi:hypothetical protein
VHARTIAPRGTHRSTREGDAARPLHTGSESHRSHLSTEYRKAGLTLPLIGVSVSGTAAELRLTGRDDDVLDLLHVFLRANEAEVTGPTPNGADLRRVC